MALDHAIPVCDPFGGQARQRSASRADEQDVVVKAPDWVYIRSASPVVETRRSYTAHTEGEVPTIVAEFLSDTDNGEYSTRRFPPYGKWWFYEQILQVPIYAIFEPESGLLEVYQLKQQHYQQQQPDQNNRYWLAEMGLFLGVWQGTKAERTGYWLRWWDEGGNLLLWGVERLEQERQRTEQERQRAERLADMLRSQGIDPDSLA